MVGQQIQCSIEGRQLLRTLASHEYGGRLLDGGLHGHHGLRVRHGLGVDCHRWVYRGCRKSQLHGRGMLIRWLAFLLEHGTVS